MTYAIGHQLLALLDELKIATNWQITATEDDGSASKWQIVGSTWKAIVIVDALRWIGLEFEARDPVTDRRLSYDIDTDLYPITQDGRADEIEQDIIEFLNNLRKGHMLRGKDGSRVVLVFPRGRSYVRVVRGRFATTASRHVDEMGARGTGEYVPVV